MKVCVTSDMGNEPVEVIWKLLQCRVNKTNAICGSSTELKTATLWIAISKCSRQSSLHRFHSSWFTIKHQTNVNSCWWENVMSELRCRFNKWCCTFHLFALIVWRSSVRVSVILCLLSLPTQSWLAHLGCWHSASHREITHKTLNLLLHPGKSSNITLCSSLNVKMLKGRMVPCNTDASFSSYS